MVRQFANETDGIGNENLGTGREVDSARGSVECSEQTVFHEDIGPGKTSQDGRLADVGVTDERRAKFVGTAFTLRRTALCYGLELFAKIADAQTDQTTVGFELRFTGPAQTDTAADARQVCPHAFEARQQILQLRELDLHLRFGRTSTCRKDVEDQLGAIHDAHADVLLEIFTLGRAQLFVEYDEIGAIVLDGLLDLFGFAFADVELWSRLVDFLADPRDDASARGVHQLGQLGEMLIGYVRRYVFSRRTDENSTFFGELNVLGNNDCM